MGMFDDFKTPGLKCKNCKNNIEEVQSKEFMRDRSCYNTGDSINMYEGTFIEKGYFQEESYCRKCHTHGHNIRFFIKNNIYIKFKIIKEKNGS
jgi:hypothetical protein